MKHIHFFLYALGFALLGAMRLPGETTVYSVNVIGVQKVVANPESVAGGRQILGVPLDALPGNLDQVIGTAGTANNSSALADNVVIYDLDQPLSDRYRTFYLRNNPNEGGRPMWRFAGSPQFWATNVYLHPGQGFWYINRSASAVTNVIVGDVQMADYVDTAIVPGLQLLSNPFSAPMTLGEAGLTNGVATTSSATADNITVFDPDALPAEQYKTYFLRPDPGNGNAPRWRFAGSPQSWADGVVLEPHQGFWYRSRAGENFMWAAPRPYPAQ
ncbi:MAG TPA: hypothetical protein PKE55_02720 [Kiritimatiellia bacterium]|nr:hypothetical protein [Kiritimatiellia bacterium]